MKNFVAVDIFSGAGGMSLGATLAGITPILAIEIDKYASNTYANNHPNTMVLQKDISTVNPTDYIDTSPFVLSGGPPCQGFSVANTKTRNIDNPNNWMFKEYIRFVNSLKPSWFIFENVEGFKSFGKGQFALDVESELRNLGYETNASVLNAADFGVPQKRSRYFIIGNRIDKGGIKFDFSNLSRQAHITVKEAVSDLPSMTNGEKADKKEYKTKAISKYAKLMRANSSHATQNYLTENKPHIIERYKVIKEGENWKAAQNNGHLDSYSSTKNTHSGIYKRLEQSKPSVTIANYRKSMLIHPIEHRGLSLREAARLQSFPDDFLFDGSLMYQQQQVGNAVPPYLAKAIFEEIICLEKGLSNISMNNNSISCLS